MRWYPCTATARSSSTASCVVVCNQHRFSIDILSKVLLLFYPMKDSEVCVRIPIHHHCGHGGCHVTSHKRPNNHLQYEPHCAAQQRKPERNCWSTSLLDWFAVIETTIITPSVCPHLSTPALLLGLGSSKQKCISSLLRFSCNSRSFKHQLCITRVRYCTGGCILFYFTTGLSSRGLFELAVRPRTYA